LLIDVLQRSNQTNASDSDDLKSLFWSESGKSQSLNDMLQRNSFNIQKDRNSDSRNLYNELQQLYQVKESVSSKRQFKNISLNDIDNKIAQVRRRIDQEFIQRPTSNQKDIDVNVWIVEFQNKLMKGELAVALRFTDSDSYLWLIDYETVTSKLISNTPEFIESIGIIQSYYKVTRYGEQSLPPEVLRALQRIKSKIFGDIIINKYSKVVISPHSHFQKFPINALHYFEEFNNSSFSYTPSLMISGKNSNTINVDNRILIVSDPVFNKSAVKQLDSLDLMRGNLLGSLPFSEREGQYLEHYFGTQNSKHLNRTNATKSNVIDNLQNNTYQILHFATHGLFNRDIPELSGLALSATSTKLYEILTINEIMELEINVQTVVLSACESLLGEGIEDEGMVGLSYAFLAAGAQEVYATLWPIADKKAFEDVQELYQKESVTNGQITLSTNDPAWVKYEIL